MKAGILQINSTVGDFSGNLRKVSEGYRRLVTRGAELVVAPELVLAGYAAQDLFFRADFLREHERVARQLVAAVGEVPLIFGAVEPLQADGGKPLWNSAWVARKGEVVARAHKSLLPTYDVFDENRYFRASDQVSWFELAGHRIGLTICEDIWNDADFWQRSFYQRDPVRELCAQGVDWIVNISASPWHMKKDRTRLEMLRTIACREKVGVIQANLVGGNDELIFDGQSLVISPTGRLVGWGHAFAEDLLLVDATSGPAISEPEFCEEAQLFDALATGLRDYVRKCGFSRVVLGLSGGIDSAVTATVAVEALGPEAVLGVLMPGPHSSPGSIQDAMALARALEIETLTVSISPAYEVILASLAPVFADDSADVTQENIQSRLRGLTLMALANRQNRLVLTTGNKSELAVGYCTLYGDMCGALGVLSDVWKTEVYALARWINRRGTIIPESTIHKPPSAELRPDQKDEDSLPPYSVLDRMLSRYIVEDASMDQLVADGFDPSLLRDIMRRVDLSEYKRRQAAPGLKVSPRAFGQGRRRAIAQTFRPWEL